MNLLDALNYKQKNCFSFDGCSHVPLTLANLSADDFEIDENCLITRKPCEIVSEGGVNFTCDLLANCDLTQYPELKGADGADGAQGIQGIAGAPGVPGIQGPAGTNGTDGIDGVDGINGIDGTDGINGINGLDGTPDWSDLCTELGNVALDCLGDVPTPTVNGYLFWNGTNLQWQDVTSGGGGDFSCADLNACSITSLADVLTLTPNQNVVLDADGNVTSAPFQSSYTFDCSELSTCSISSLSDVSNLQPNQSLGTDATGTVISVPNQGAFDPTAYTVRLFDGYFCYETNDGCAVGKEYITRDLTGTIISTENVDENGVVITGFTECDCCLACSGETTDPCEGITGPVTATIVPANPTVTGSFQVTITFSRSVTGLSLIDFASTNSTLSNLTGSGTTYTLTVTPSATGNGTVSLNAGAVDDGCGNTNTSTTSSFTANITTARVCEWTEEGEECFQTSTTTGGNTSYTIPDAYTAQSFSDLQNAINWGNGVDLLIGEHGTPNDRPADQALHNTRTEAELAFLACNGVGWTGWSTGQNWGSDFLQIYDDNGNPTPGAPGYQNSFGNTTITGVNYAHFDFDNGTGWPPGLIGPQTLSNFQAIAADGATHLRLPTLWKYSLADQNNIFSDIAQSFKDAYCLTLDYAQQAGLKVIVGIHEYGQFNHKIDPNNCQQTIGTTGSLHDAYLAHVDNLLEVQCNTATHNGPLYQHPAFAGLDIMNEPRCITWQNWESISQDVYNQVRANQGNGVTLFIPTAGGYSGAQDASPNGANVHQQGPWITGAVNVIYEFHYYSHKNHSGIPGQWQSYAQENQDAINAGYGVGGNQTYNEGDVITNCPLLAGGGTTLGPCETYTKEVERYTDAPFEICGGTRYKDENGTVTDVSGLQSCVCPTVTQPTTYVSCPGDAGNPVCPVDVTTWHRITGTDGQGNSCVVGYSNDVNGGAGGECYFNGTVPQSQT